MKPLRASWAPSAIQEDLLSVKSHFEKEIGFSKRQNFHLCIRISASYLKSHRGIEETDISAPCNRLSLVEVKCLGSSGILQIGLPFPDIDRKTYGKPSKAKNGGVSTPRAHLPQLPRKFLWKFPTLFFSFVFGG